MDIPFDNITALRTDTYHGWMSSGPTRATTDILWTCLATIILCVYTAVHLNVPAPGEPAYRQILRRAKWVVIAILAPELILQSAWKQFGAALILKKQLREHARKRRNESAGPKHEADSTHEMHSLLPDGDTPASKSGSRQSMNELSDATEIPEDHEITLTYAFYAVMGGLRLKFNHGPYAGKSFCATPRIVEALAKQDGVFWNVSTETIQDRSKADSLAKLLTVVQVVWLLIQCIARRVLHLPSTILELHTFIHAVCGGIMFGLWFKKPLDVRSATTITCPESIAYEIKDRYLSKRTGDLVRRQQNFGQGHDLNGDRSIFDGFVDQLWGMDHLIDLGSTDGRKLTDLLDLGGISLVQIVYGAFHAVAWNAHFPTEMEMWFWRGSCIVMASTFICIAAVALLLGFLSSTASEHTSWSEVALVMAYVTGFLVLGALWLAWLTSRLFIVVESLISLRSVPIGVYVTVPWANYLPHL